MPNENYKKGRRKEYKLVEQLRNEGYQIVQRTAGSHSPVDIIAIHKEKKEILLIQSKPNNISQKLIDSISLENEWLTGEFHVEFQIR